MWTENGAHSRADIQASIIQQDNGKEIEGNSGIFVTIGKAG